ncbi:hypothetical protein HK102_010821, partial [Quaeritorhiza haematococci]
EAYMDITEEVNKRILSMDWTDADIEVGPLVNWEGAGILVGEQISQSRGWKDLQLLHAAHLSTSIRTTIHTELSYTCSTGIAHNKTLAKLCSALHKPNKQTVLRE